MSQICSAHELKVNEHQTKSARASSYLVLLIVVRERSRFQVVYGGLPAFMQSQSQCAVARPWPDLHCRLQDELSLCYWPSAGICEMQRFLT